MADKNCIMPGTITVATSIAPFNIDNQKKAISTWINAGFEVISFNCQEEIDVLKDLFVDINFVRVNRDGRQAFGKPFIYFNDIMEYFKNSQCDTCGIINSDIHMLCIDDSFKNFVLDEARGSIVFGSRVEIKSIESLNGFFYIGHDYFFFDKKLAAVFPEEDFFIGQPAWDYWIVFIAIISRFKAKKIVNPIAFHISHPIRWEEDLNIKLINIIISKYFNKARGLLKYIDCDNDYEKFHMLIENIPDRIVYKKKVSYDILVVYDRKNANIEESLTYKSIHSQTYNNIRVVESDRAKFDIDSIKEDLVLFISEGAVLHKDYFKIMVNYIELGDCCVCGFKLKATQYNYMREIYPADMENIAIEGEAAIDECVLYRKDVLKSHNGYLIDSNKYKVSFVHNALVYIDYEDHITRIISKVKGERIYIYGAGGHTNELLRKVDFSNYNICGILDRNMNLTGSKLGGYEVNHVSKIKELDIDYILISSISYEREIYNELKKVFNKNRLLRIYYN